MGRSAHVDHGTATRRARRGVAVCVAVLSAASPPVRGQGLPPTDTAWRYTAGSDIQFIRECPAAELLVATKKALVALDAATGAHLWEVTDLPDFDPGLFWGACDAATGFSYRTDTIVAFDLVIPPLPPGRGGQGCGLSRGRRCGLPPQPPPQVREPVLRVHDRGRARSLARSALAQEHEPATAGQHVE